MPDQLQFVPYGGVDKAIALKPYALALFAEGGTPPYTFSTPDPGELPAEFAEVQGYQATLDDLKGIAKWQVNPPTGLTVETGGTVDGKPVDGSVSGDRKSVV